MKIKVKKTIEAEIEVGIGTILTNSRQPKERRLIIGDELEEKVATLDLGTSCLAVEWHDSVETLLKHFYYRGWEVDGTEFSL